MNPMDTKSLAGEWEAMGFEWMGKTGKKYLMDVDKFEFSYFKFIQANVG